MLHYVLFAALSLGVACSCDDLFDDGFEEVMAYQTTLADGGLDLITPPIGVKAGRLLACKNYEVARQRGYSRMDGYEKYDGGPSPSFCGTNGIRITQSGTTGADITSWFAVGDAVQFSTSYQGVTYTYTGVSVQNNSVYIGGPSHVTNVDFIVVLSSNSGFFTDNGLIRAGTLKDTTINQSLSAIYSPQAAPISFASSASSYITQAQALFNAVSSNVQ